MNTYSLKFWAKCPVDGATVDYEWTLYTGDRFMCEELRRVADGFGEALHEVMADALHDRFGGQQKLVATHAGGVKIETRRPMFVHWARPGHFESATPTAPSAPAAQMEERIAAAGKPSLGDLMQKYDGLPEVIGWVNPAPNASVPMAPNCEVRTVQISSATHPPQPEARAPGVTQDYHLRQSEQAALKHALFASAKKLPEARAPLSDEEIDLIANDGMRNAAGGIYATCVYEFARAVERYHGIGVHLGEGE